jgi:hypothetical protein
MTNSEVIKFLLQFMKLLHVAVNSESGV